MSTQLQTLLSTAARSKNKQRCWTYIQCILAVVDHYEDKSMITAADWKRIRRYWNQCIPYGSPRDWRRTTRLKPDTVKDYWGPSAVFDDVRRALTWATLALELTPYKPYRLKVYSLYNPESDPLIAWGWTTKYSTPERRAQAIKAINAHYKGKFACKIIS